MAQFQQDLFDAAQAGFDLLTISEIRKRDVFDGKDENFEAWAFPFEIEAAHLGWDGLTTAAVASNGALPNQGWLAEHFGVNRNLYLWLSQRLRGKALTIVMGVEAGMGFEALRLLFKEYRPRGDTSHHNMLVTIIQPKWWTTGAHAARPFMENILDWEKLIIQYEIASREFISEGTKCATLTGYAPQNVKDVIAAAGDTPQLQIVEASGSGLRAGS